MITSRHRLPEPYRSLLCALWLTPTTLLALTLIRFGGLSWALLHPLTLGALALMTLPAWYVWREGVDVTDKALHIRITGWHHRHFDQLTHWHLDRRNPDAPILKVWDEHGRMVIYTHATHLTELPLLLRVLKSRVTWHDLHSR
ncbi:MAG: hypothetical protein AAF125_27410 [Chloroflexota bacterium]